MNNNRPPASNFQKSERETGNQVSLALLSVAPFKMAEDCCYGTDVILECVYYNACHNIENQTEH